jgi:hypothetical protein
MQAPLRSKIMAHDKMVVAVFRDRTRATAAYNWLRARFYSPDQINVMMSQATHNHFEAESAPISAGTHVLEGVAAGGSVGTAIGAAAAAVAAVGTSVAVPGLGLVVAGPILAGLVGAGAGAVAGGFLGGLIGLGIPESNASAYEAALKEGGVVLGVLPRPGDEAAIQAQLAEFKGENIIVTNN